MPQIIPAGQNVVSYQKLAGMLIERFGKPVFDFALLSQLHQLERCFPNPSEVKRLRVLDLGCGCESGAAETVGNRGVWSPWLCRAIEMLGGKAVGVDIGRQSEKDTFEFHKIDLAEPGALDCFRSGSFDVFNCTNLFCSPHLSRLGLRIRDRVEMKNRISSDVRRLLRLEGNIIQFDTLAGCD